MILNLEQPNLLLLDEEKCSGCQKKTSCGVDAPKRKARVRPQNSPAWILHGKRDKGALSDAAITVFRQMVHSNIVNDDGEDGKAMKIQSRVVWAQFFGPLTQRNNCEQTQHDADQHQVVARWMRMLNDSENKIEKGHPLTLRTYIAHLHPHTQIFIYIHFHEQWIHYFVIYYSLS